MHAFRHELTHLETDTTCIPGNRVIIPAWYHDVDTYVYSHAYMHDVDTLCKP